MIQPSIHPIYTSKKKYRWYKTPRHSLYTKASSRASKAPTQNPPPGQARLPPRNLQGKQDSHPKPSSRASKTHPGISSRASKRTDHPPPGQARLSPRNLLQGKQWAHGPFSSRAGRNARRARRTPP